MGVVEGLAVLVIGDPWYSWRTGVHDERVEVRGAGFHHQDSGGVVVHDALVERVSCAQVPGLAASVRSAPHNGPAVGAAQRALREEHSRDVAVRSVRQEPKLRMVVFQARVEGADEHQIAVLEHRVVALHDPHAGGAACAAFAPRAGAPEGVVLREQGVEARGRIARLPERFGHEVLVGLRREPLRGVAHQPDRMAQFVRQVRARAPARSAAPVRVPPPGRASSPGAPGVGLGRLSASAAGAGRTRTGAARGTSNVATGSGIGGRATSGTHEARGRAQRYGARR